MGEFVEAIKGFLQGFVQDTGLTIVRTIAFLVLGLIVIKIVQTITRNVSLRSSKLDNSAATFVISVVTVVLYVALIIVLVTSLGFSTAGIIAGFSAVALAIALALKDSLGSLANGVIIIFNKPFKKGDYVRIGDYDGLVQDIRLFNTKILTYTNEEIIIPNSEVLSKELINYSTMPLRRVDIELPVPYGSDVSAVKAALLERTRSYKYVVTSPAPSAVLSAYGDSALKISVRAWTPDENYWDTLFDLKESYYELLTEKGIAIPFNQLDVHIVSGQEEAAKTEDKK